MPSKERFQTRLMGRAFKRCLLSEISCFVEDSSRSYANFMVLFSGLFLADADD